MEFLIFFNLTFNSILKRTDKTAILIRLGILAKAVQYEYKRKGGFSKHFKKHGSTSKFSSVNFSSEYCTAGCKTALRLTQTTQLKEFFLFELS